MASIAKPLGPAAALCLVLCVLGLCPRSAMAQQEGPAFVIVERTATTGPEAIQKEYARLAREILPKYGGPLSRPQSAEHAARRQWRSALLHGDP